jgi:diaminopimelate decarboxylase/aspartate kinase
VSLDSLYPLQHWPDIFSNRDVMVRIDIGACAGVHGSWS